MGQEASVWLMWGMGTFISVIFAVASASFKAHSYLAKGDEKVNDRFMALRQHIEHEKGSLMRGLGESLAAVQEKIRLNEVDAAKKMAQIEIWNRDTFARRAEVMESIQAINRAIELLGAKMDSGIASIRADMKEEIRGLEARIEKWGLTRPQ